MRVHCIFTFIFLAACGGKHPQSNAKQRDPGSGGPHLAGNGAVSVDEQPFLDLGGEASDGNLRFTRAVDATLLSSGTLVVADVAESHLVFIRPDGTIQRRVGRNGHGPGEFRHLLWLGRCAADTVFTWDPALNRITLVDSSGHVSREILTSRHPARMDCSGNSKIGVILRVSSMGAPGKDSPIYRAPLLVWNTAGDSIGSIGEVEVGENRPLGRIAHFATGPDWLYYGNGQSAEIRIYSYDGNLKGTIHAGTPNRPVLQEHYDAAIDRLIMSVNTPPEMQRLIRERFRAIPAPATLPPYSGFVADPNGIIWVTTSVLGDSSVVIEGLTNDGKVIGTVRFPSGFELLEVGKDYMLGLYSAQEGTQKVVAHRYHRQ